MSVVVVDGVVSIGGDGSTVSEGYLEDGKPNPSGVIPDPPPSGIRPCGCCPGVVITIGVDDVLIEPSGVVVPAEDPLYGPLAGGGGP